MSLVGGKIICLNENGARGRVIQAKGNRFAFGHRIDSDVVLIDGRASHVHCDISCDAFGRVTVRNHSTLDPVKIDDFILCNKRPLANGSRITILDQDYLWEFPSASSNAEQNIPSSEETPEKQVCYPEPKPYSCPALKIKPNFSQPRRFTVTRIGIDSSNSDDKNNVAPASIEDSSPIGCVTPKAVPVDPSSPLEVAESPCDAQRDTLPSQFEFAESVVTTDDIEASSSFNAYSTTESVMSDRVSRDLLDSSTPVTSRKVLPDKQSDSMHYIDLTSPSAELRPDSPAPKSTSRDLKRNLPSRTTSMSLTPKTSCDDATPSSPESVICIDSGDSGDSTSSIEVTVDMGKAPSVVTPLRAVQPLRQRAIIKSASNNLYRRRTANRASFSNVVIKEEDAEQPCDVISVGSSTPPNSPDLSTFLENVDECLSSEQVNESDAGTVETCEVQRVDEQDEQMQSALVEPRPQLSEDEEKENKMNDTEISTSNLMVGSDVETTKKRVEPEERYDDLSMPHTTLDDVSILEAIDVLLASPTISEVSADAGDKESSSDNSSEIAQKVSIDPNAPKSRTRRASMPSVATMPEAGATTTSKTPDATLTPKHMTRRASLSAKATVGQPSAFTHALFTPKRITRRSSLSVAQSATISESICTPRRIMKRRLSICLGQPTAELKPPMNTVDDLILEKVVEETLDGAEVSLVEKTDNGTEPGTNDGDDSRPSTEPPTKKVKQQPADTADNDVVVEESICEVISDSECDVDSPPFEERDEVEATVSNDIASFSDVVEQAQTVQFVQILQFDDSDAESSMVHTDSSNASEYDYGKEIDGAESDDIATETIAPQEKEAVTETDTCATNIVALESVTETDTCATNIVALESSTGEPRTPEKQQAFKAQSPIPATPVMPGLTQTHTISTTQTSTPYLVGMKPLCTTPNQTPIGRSQEAVMVVTSVPGTDDPLATFKEESANAADSACDFRSPSFKALLMPERSLGAGDLLEETPTSNTATLLAATDSAAEKETEGDEIADTASSCSSQPNVSADEVGDSMPALEEHDFTITSSMTAEGLSCDPLSLTALSSDFQESSAKMSVTLDGGSLEENTSEEGETTSTEMPTQGRDTAVVARAQSDGNHATVEETEAQLVEKDGHANEYESQELFCESSPTVSPSDSIEPPTILSETSNGGGLDENTSEEGETTSAEMPPRGRDTAAVACAESGGIHATEEAAEAQPVEKDGQAIENEPQELFCESSPTVSPSDSVEPPTIISETSNGDSLEENPSKEGETTSTEMAPRGRDTAVVACAESDGIHATEEAAEAQPVEKDGPANENEPQEIFCESSPTVSPSDSVEPPTIISETSNGDSLEENTSEEGGTTTTEMPPRGRDTAVVARAQSDGNHATEEEAEAQSVEKDGQANEDEPQELICESFSPTVSPSDSVESPTVLSETSNGGSLEENPSEEGETTSTDMPIRGRDTAVVARAQSDGNHATEEEAEAQSVEKDGPANENEPQEIFCESFSPTVSPTDSVESPTVMSETSNGGSLEANSSEEAQTTSTDMPIRGRDTAVVARAQSDGNNATKEEAEAQSVEKDGHANEDEPEEIVCESFSPTVSPTDSVESPTVMSETSNGGSLEANSSEEGETTSTDMPIRGRDTAVVARAQSDGNNATKEEAEAQSVEKDGHANEDEPEEIVCESFSPTVSPTDSVESPTVLSETSNGGNLEENSSEEGETTSTDMPTRGRDTAVVARAQSDDNNATKEEAEAQSVEKDGHANEDEPEELFCESFSPTVSPTDSVESPTVLSETSNGGNLEENTSKEGGTTTTDMPKRGKDTAVVARVESEDTHATEEEPKAQVKKSGRKRKEVQQRNKKEPQGHSNDLLEPSPKMVKTSEEGEPTSTDMPKRGRARGLVARVESEGQHAAEEKSKEQQVKKSGRKRKERPTDQQECENKPLENLSSAIPGSLKRTRKASTIDVGGSPAPVSPATPASRARVQRRVNFSLDHNDEVELGETSSTDMPKRVRYTAVVARRAVAGGSKRYQPINQATEEKPEAQQVKKRGGLKRKGAQIDTEFVNNNEPPERWEIIEASSTPIPAPPRRTRRAVTIDEAPPSTSRASTRSAQRRDASTNEHNVEDTTDSATPLKSKMTTTLAKPLVMSSGRIHKPSAKMQPLLEAESPKTPSKPTVAKRRGRPPKKASSEDCALETSIPTIVTPVRRRPGRPRKRASIVETDPDTTMSMVETPNKRSVGRPRKQRPTVTTPTVDVETCQGDEKIERSQTTTIEVNEEVAPRGRRPRKINVEPPQPVAPVKRGRRKVVAEVAVVAAVAEEVEGPTISRAAAQGRGRKMVRFDSTVKSTPASPTTVRATRSQKK